MFITFSCSGCGSSLEIDAAETGTRVECPECSATLTVPKAGLGPGATIGGFRIERLLGKGGMGEVYLAKQLTMHRDVALKILPSNLTDTENDVERFLQEVRTAALLEHPNIVAAHEAGEDNGVYFLAMAYVKGEALSELLTDDNLLHEKDALAITQKMVSALAYAWTKHHMLHRDVKPSNIMLDEDGEPKLMDMGLSKSLDEESGMTLSGMVMGTPNYMSPEQAEGGGEMDFRADMYSLGATLYHMVTGNMPFLGSSVMETLRKQVSESLPDPREFNPELSEGCVELMQIMLAKDAAHRHQSWEALSDDLARVLGGGQSRTELPAAGESVMLRAESAASTPRPEKKKIVLGQSTVRKLHGIERTPHEPRSAREPKSKTPVVVTAVVAVLVLGVGSGALIVAQSKKKVEARRAAVAQMAAARAGPDKDKKATAPKPRPQQKAADPKTAALKKQFDEAVRYAKEHPEDYFGADSRLKRVRKAAAGTEFATRASKEIERVETARKTAMAKAVAPTSAPKPASSA